MNSDLNNTACGDPPPPPQQAVPEGWKLVPIKMTEEMHVAAVRAIIKSTGNDNFPSAVWAAMLAAAPVPQQAVPVAYANGDELDNMLDDRTATIQSNPSGWRKTPLFAAPVPPVPAPVELDAGWAIADPASVVSRLRKAAQALLDAAGKHIGWKDDNELSRAATATDNALAACVGFVPVGSTEASAQAAPDEVRDAARYRVLRQHIAPRDISISMSVPVTEIPKDQSIEERIDMLCDIALRTTSTQPTGEKGGAA